MQNPPTLWLQTDVQDLNGLFPHFVKWDVYTETDFSSGASRLAG